MSDAKARFKEISEKINDILTSNAARYDAATIRLTRRDWIEATDRNGRKAMYFPVDQLSDTPDLLNALDNLGITYQKKTSSIRGGIEVISVTDDLHKLNSAFEIPEDTRERVRTRGYDGPGREL